ncbi:hypothetical protein ACPXCG_16535 [Gordonia sp. DT218]|uniref:hypothetical protein n=1 Tax=unclassified Gordonia (in: high G+C Gram-positive bacteria) TaxID=2657482 RepID=UPI003CEB70FC
MSRPIRSRRRFRFGLGAGGAVVELDRVRRGGTPPDPREPERPGSAERLGGSAGRPGMGSGC